MEKLIIPASEVWKTSNNYNLVVYYRCSICGDLLMSPTFPRKEGCTYYIRVKNLQYDALDNSVSIAGLRKQSTLF